MQGIHLLESALFLLLILNLSPGTVLSQSLPPERYDGFVFTKTRVDSDTILIEAFFDPVCPYSRDSWPPLKQAILDYHSGVSLVVHLLPLPYHDNAYAASRALHIINELRPSATFKLLDRFFKHQENFYGAQTRNLSRADVVNEIIKFATEAVGHSYYSAIESGFNDRITDLKTRVSFKYSASRGVSGTPTFYVNGFLLPDTGSLIGYNGWRSIIDRLISAQENNFGK